MKTLYRKVAVSESEKPNEIWKDVVGYEGIYSDEYLPKISKTAEQYYTKTFKSDE